MDAARVNQDLDNWWQGDYFLLGDLPDELRFEFLHLSLTEETGSTASDPIEWTPGVAEGFALFSQTCDVIRPWQEGSERKWVTLCPVVGLAKSRWRQVLSGGHPRYRTFPHLEAECLALDLERVLRLPNQSLRA